MVFGLKTVGGATYYFGDDGAAVVGEMVIDGVTYVFGEDGKKIS
jgi:glucan-binding YG repeat protein